MVYLHRVHLWSIFIVCLFVSSWCASLVCFHRVPLWPIFMVCLFSLSSWCASLVYLHGVSLWSIFMCLFGLCSWWASLVYLHGEPVWSIFMVCLFCLFSWCPSLAYLHVLLGSVFMVGLHGDYRRRERPLRRDPGDGDTLNSLCHSSACNLRSAVA